MHSSPVKYLIVIDAGGSMVARMFDANRVHITDIDASTEELGATINGAIPTGSAREAVWDHVLVGHSAAERAAAQVYTLAI